MTFGASAEEIAAMARNSTKLQLSCPAVFLLHYDMAIRANFMAVLTLLFSPRVFPTTHFSLVAECRSR